ncbi:MAG: hypothetical protein IPM92_03020 [Saprospiraceae bacterium]|nr:hypothetical protein [Saprospiraceae bacterium]
MITDDEIKWISEYCPSLNINQDRSEVSGLINFRAAYDKEGGFTWLIDDKQMAKGEILQDSYEVLVKKADKLTELPSLQLKIDEGKINIGRHFYPDGKACLCGPAERGKFIQSGFLFTKFLERLVVPFLYEQTYFDKYEKWPWNEYAHGSAGIFQSFAFSDGTKEDIEACLQDLRKDKNWPRIKAMLSGHERVTESSICFCNNPKQIRKCHPDILFRMAKLRSAIQKQSIRLN